MSRVTEIRYVGYAVPDLEAERAFYKDKWGLREVAQVDGMTYFATYGHDELYVVRLRRDELQRVDVIGLAADTRADVDALHAKVEADGCRIIDRPHDLAGFGGGYGFRFFSHDGLTFEISSDVARGEARAMQRWEGIPEKISHIVLHSPRHKELVQWFVDVLGFRLTDWVGDFMGFVRCNEWHHRIAVLPGPPCVNHVAYDMHGIDDMMLGMGRLKKQDINLVWGPGRHTAGDNAFSYFTTPHGFVVEYTSDLEKVDDASWEPRVHTPTPTTMDQWGVGVGGPQNMPEPKPDPGLFKAPAA